MYQIVKLHHLIMILYKKYCSKTLESNYYIYAMTGEQIYFDRALEYLEDIMDASKCNDTICTGHSALEDTNTLFENHVDNHFFMLKHINICI